MPARRHVLWEVIRLDWRLLLGAGRAGGPEQVLPWLVGVAVFAVACDSALTTAAAVASAPPAVIGPLASTYVWNTCFAVGALAVASGGLSTGRRITRQLAQEAVTPFQVYGALWMLSVAGRHALVAAVALAPVVCLLAGLIDSARLAAVIVASVLVLRSIPGLVRAIAATCGVVPYRLLALVCVGVGVLAVALGPWVDVAVEALPPNLVVQLALGVESPQHVWLRLIGWTVAIDLLDFATLSLNAAPPPPARGPVTISVIPAWIRALARVCAVSAPLLHGELLRLLRWRRFLLGWGVYAAAAAVGLGRLMSPDPGILPTLLLALAPPFVALSTLGNLFAPDRAGVQAFFLVLDTPHSVIRAKIAAVTVFVGIAECVTWGAVVALISPRWELAHAYAPMLAVTFHAWITTAGRATSILFPAPTDPRGVGDGLMKGAGALLLVSACGALLLAAVGPAFLYDTNRIDVAWLLSSGVVTVGVVSVVTVLASRVVDRVWWVRREQFIGAVAVGSTAS